ncbi:MAG: hypothetical protein AAF242_15405, partial [Bacteroidota bacterium]
DAMVSSGKKNILKNDDLKRVLSQFSADINSGFEDHFESMNYLIEMNKISADIMPALIHGLQSESLGLKTTEAALKHSVEQLINNEHYLGLLISKTWLETLRINYQQRLESYIEEVLSLCKGELGE